MDNFGARDTKIQFVVLGKAGFGQNYNELHHDETMKGAIEYITGTDKDGKHIAGHRDGNSGYEYQIKNRKGEIV